MERARKEQKITEGLARRKLPRWAGAKSPSAPSSRFRTHNSRRICSYNSTFALQSNEFPPLGQIKPPSWARSEYRNHDLLEEVGFVNLNWRKVHSREE